MDFYQTLKHFHSGWAYAVVLFAVILFGFTIYLFATKKNISKTYKKISFYTTLSFHIQFLAGIILYFFLSPLGIKSELTFYKFEHPSMMFAAVLFITIANAKIKRSGVVKLPIVILVFLSILLIFLMIPGTHTFGFIQNIIR